MKSRTIAVALAILMISQFTATACQKKEKEAATITPKEAFDTKALKESFVKSKTDIIAKVNGEPITMFYLLRKMTMVTHRYMGRDKTPPPEMQRKIEKESLNALIFQYLAVQEAKRRGMKVKPEEVDLALRKMKQQAGSEKAFQGYIASIGMTEDEVRQTIERERLYAQIVAEVATKDVTISDAALRERYNKDKKEYMTNDKPPRQMSFKEAKEAIEQKMRAEAGAEKIRDWEKELRKYAVIEIAS